MTCPICDYGTLEPKLETPDGILLFYSVCDKCGSETADKHQVAKNNMKYKQWVGNPSPESPNGLWKKLGCIVVSKNGSPDNKRHIFDQNGNELHIPLVGDEITTGRESELAFAKRLLKQGRI